MVGIVVEKVKSGQNSPLPDDKKGKAMSENPLMQTLNLGRYLNNNYNDISLLARKHILLHPYIM